MEIIYFKYHGIIIIDDYRGPHIKYKFCQQDWSQIDKQQILNKLRDRIIKFYHLPSLHHKRIG